MQGTKLPAAAPASGAPFTGASPGNIGTNTEQAMMAMMQATQPIHSARLRPMASEMKPTTMLDAIAATLFQVCRVTDSAGVKPLPWNQVGIQAFMP